jgi:hypothetical protein
MVLNELENEKSMMFVKIKGEHDIRIKNGGINLCE